jgi:phosphoribosylformimino-5-aminoimidazole carboxamide ribonucleotide (ProFAR) isomerase
LRRIEEHHHPGVVGVIIGKAIYRGRVDLEALFRREE